MKVKGRERRREMRKKRSARVRERERTEGRERRDEVSEGGGLGGS